MGGELESSKYSLEWVNDTQVLVNNNGKNGNSGMPKIQDIILVSSLSSASGTQPS